MKIVDRKTFLELPIGTIYSKYQPCVFDGFNVKTSSPEDEWGNDWVYVPLTDGFIKNADDVSDISYEHFEFDLDCTTRDGLYEEKQLFAIYEKEDILKLIARLTYSFLEADMD